AKLEGRLLGEAFQGFRKTWMPSDELVGEDSRVVCPERFCSALPERIPMPMVLVEAPSGSEHAPPREREPVHAAREALQRGACAATDDPLRVVALAERADQSALTLPPARLDVACADRAPSIQHAIDPRDHEP